MRKLSDSNYPHKKYLRHGLFLLLASFCVALVFVSFVGAAIPDNVEVNFDIAHAELKTIGMIDVNAGDEVTVVTTITNLKSSSPTIFMTGLLGIVEENGKSERFTIDLSSFTYNTTSLNGIKVDESYIRVVYNGKRTDVPIESGITLSDIESYELMTAEYLVTDEINQSSSATVVFSGKVAESKQYNNVIAFVYAQPIDESDFGVTITLESNMFKDSVTYVKQLPSEENTPLPSETPTSPGFGVLAVLAGFGIVVARCRH